MSHRSWFPYILIGLSLTLMAILAVTYEGKKGEGKEGGDENIEIVVPTPAQYEAGVRAVLAAFDDSKNASLAIDSLVAMVVPSNAYQEAHLEFVLAFSQIKLGEVDAGMERLTAARALYNWSAESAM